MWKQYNRVPAKPAQKLHSNKEIAHWTEIISQPSLLSVGPVTMMDYVYFITDLDITREYDRQLLYRYKQSTG